MQDKNVACVHGKLQKISLLDQDKTKHVLTRDLAFLHCFHFPYTLLRTQRFLENRTNKSFFVPDLSKTGSIWKEIKMFDKKVRNHRVPSAFAEKHKWGKVVKRQKKLCETVYISCLIIMSYYNFMKGTLISTFFNSLSHRLNHMLEQYGTDAAGNRDRLYSNSSNRSKNQTMRSVAVERQNKRE